MDDLTTHIGTVTTSVILDAINAQPEGVRREVVRALAKRDPHTGWVIDRRGRADLVR